MSTLKSSANPVTPFMRMGCTNVTITYRPVGSETICLESASHGVQQLVGFDPSKGDVIGIDDIVEQTTAAANLSDISKYITSTVSNVGTTLYFDPTGHGLQGTPFAVLQGVNTSVAQLVANGGMKYVPDAITVTPQFNTPLNMRPAGLETVDLLHYAPGMSPQQINGFNPTGADVLELRSILNQTTAAPDLSDISNYLGATTVNGNTILSVDFTGSGHPSAAFAELNGVSVTVAQLVADAALVFNPSPTTISAPAGATLSFRPEGQEVVSLPAKADSHGYATLNDFSLTNGDAMNLAAVFAAHNVSPTTANLGNYISTTLSAGSTQLWFDPTGSGHGGGVELAVLNNTHVSFSSLVAANALHLT